MTFQLIGNDCPCATLVPAGKENTIEALCDDVPVTEINCVSRTLVPGAYVHPLRSHDGASEAPAHIERELSNRAVYCPALLYVCEMPAEQLPAALSVQSDGSEPSPKSTYVPSACCIWKTTASGAEPDAGVAVNDELDELPVTVTYVVATVTFAVPILQAPVQ